MSSHLLQSQIRFAIDHFTFHINSSLIISQMRNVACEINEKCKLCNVKLEFA